MNNDIKILSSNHTAVPGVCVWPADVVNRNVSELLVHGRLVFPVWQEVEGGLRVLIGHIYPNFSCALIKKNRVITAQRQKQQTEHLKQAGFRSITI